MTRNPTKELEQPPWVAVAGRMMLKRVMGKASFATLQDMAGRIQLYVTNDGPAKRRTRHSSIGTWAIFSAPRDAVQDQDRRTVRQGHGAATAAKSLRPLPEKFHGLADQEQKYRQRYLDLITNPESQRVFKTRSSIIQSIREFFVARGYLEVETPMMQPIPGGAAARPFVTHHNALDMRTVSSHCAGALSEAPGNRWHRESVRNQPQFPE